MVKINIKLSSEILKLYPKMKEKFWHNMAKKNRFALFRKMARQLPAYKKFLWRHRLDYRRIQNKEDLDKVPPITKQEYFRMYSIKDKLWPKLIEQKGLVVTSTSGSTGKPNYFLRTENLDWQYSVLIEFFLNNGPFGRTLVVDCFGMGVWIGGVITYQAFYAAAQRGLPLTIITPGVNKKEIFSALREVGPSYENIIFCGYPPFLKDLVDEAVLEGVNLKKYNCRFLFAAESFTENFRDYIVARAKVKNIYQDTLNIYGTAELGAMAFETPTSIFIRRLALAYPQVFSRLFDKNRIPTLCQYNPIFVSFEQIEDEILISADSAMPVFRYRIGDRGGVYTLSEIASVFSDSGVNLEDHAKRAHINLSALPFVYVYERADFSTTLYGLQIYPQTIKRALENSAIQKTLTGKFTLQQGYDKRNNQYLIIHLELKPQKHATKSFSSLVEKEIVKILLKENSEFRELSNVLNFNRTRPHLNFLTYNSKEFFKSGIKQMWLKK